jgi:membrane-associated phospholipid phosphatase
MMVVHEWLAVAYFAGLSLAAAATAVPGSRRLTVAALAGVAALTVAVVASFATPSLRAWAPHLYLVAGYWLPGLLAVPPSASTRFERWLLQSDAALRHHLPMPAALVHFTEVAYLLCYPLIPAAFAIVWTRGDEPDIQRFWVAVLAAGYACYASLPWLVSRPPRLVANGGDRPGEARLAGGAFTARAVNILVLRRVSHELNTFPSGHVAVSSAAAAMLAPVSPVAALVIGTMAIAIALGAVAGRYHYVADVLLGFAVAAAAAAVALRI